METVFSKCGFDCSRCPAFEANSETIEEREHGAAIWEKYFGLQFKPGVVRCKGCQTLAPWSTGNLLPDRACPIRACAIHNEVRTCASCLSFPCKEYSRRVPGPGLRHEREAETGTAITDQEWREHLEQYDGQSHLAELHRSISAAELVPPKPLQTSVALPFPPESAIAVGTRNRMKNVHSLMTRVLSRTGDTFAEQIVINRQLPLVAGLLWVLAFYGRPQNEALVLESRDHVGRKECERLVRKSSNTPHENTQNAIAILAQSGVKIDFRPERKGWTLSMRVDKDAGGATTLLALKEYTEVLTERYGTPTYVDGFNLRGKAFRDFKKADMNVFQKQ